MELHGWIIFGWIALPTVMYGGYSLMRLVQRGNILTPQQIELFRAGHAHAGVLTLMALFYYSSLSQTTLSMSTKNLACLLIVSGILSQSGGFFLRLSPQWNTWGIRVTEAGALFLVCAIAVLIYGLFMLPG